MSRSTGSVLSVNEIANGRATLIDPAIPTEQFAMPYVVPSVKREMKTGSPSIAQSDPYNLPPLYFNQIGNYPAELFEAPIENFNIKIQPTSTANTPIQASVGSRYSALVPS